MNETDADGSLTRIGFIPHIPSADPHNWLGAFGASVWNEETGEVTLDAPEPLALLEWYDSYAKAYGIENIAAFRTAYGGNGFGRNSPDGLYYTGQIATWQIGSWLYNDIGEYGPDLNFGVTKVPSPSTAANGKPGKLQANLYFVPSGAANVEGGYAFCSFMSSSKWVALNKAVPDSVTPSRISNATDPEIEASAADGCPMPATRSCRTPGPCPPCPASATWRTIPRCRGCHGLRRGEPRGGPGRHPGTGPAGGQRQAGLGRLTRPQRWGPDGAEPDFRPDPVAPSNSPQGFRRRVRHSATAGGAAPARTGPAQHEPGHPPAPALGHPVHFALARRLRGLHAYPVASLYYSFTDFNIINRLPNLVGWSNYADLFQGREDS